MFEERLDFAAKEEGIAFFVVIKRLNTKNISGAEQFFLFFVPDDKSIHTAQLVQQTSTAELLISVQQHFRVGFSRKDMAFFDQFSTNRLVVIDFAVEHQHHRFIFIKNRLAAAGQVDNGKPSETEGDILIDIACGLIGTAVGNTVAHSVDNLVSIRQAIYRKSCKSTHLYFPLNNLLISLYQALKLRPEFFSTLENSSSCQHFQHVNAA